MKKIFFSAAVISLALFSDSCFKNPVTGRSSLNFVDEGNMRSLAQQQYTSFLSTNPPVKGGGDAAMVERVGRKIADAVQRYLDSKGQGGQISGYKWEFNLVNQPEANAWCMPGGKVVVYSGILSVTRNEAGLAVVLGHEIAHAVARHGNERMSQELTSQMGGVALSAALADKPQQTQNIFMSLYGVGSQVGILLPYSRKHESEADRMGLIFMALAGYNPNEAVAFWQRMESAAKGTQPPAFLSTHPSGRQRIADIRKRLPEAMKYYKAG